MLDLVNRLHDLAWQRNSGAAIYYGPSMLLPPLFPEPEVESSRILAAMEEILAYSLVHFSFEEALMQAAGFSLPAEHCRDHDAFRRQLEEVRDQFLQGADILEDLCRHLRAWFFRHVAHDDLDLAALRQGYAAHGHGWEFPEIVEFPGEQSRV